MTHRRQLLEKNLLYMFSIDSNLEEGREDIGFVPGGLRVNVHSTPHDSRAYSVAGEAKLLGQKPVSGTIEWGTDFVLAREDDLELLDVRFVIRADDGACIEVEVHGVLAAGPRSFVKIVSEKPKFGTEKAPVDGTLFVAPRCRSGDSRYKWLSDRQCLGFGQVTLINSVARQSRLDFWMMD